MDRYDIITHAEEQFAREVALGVLYLRPLSVWHYLIPGMFIIDFLRRSSIIRKYTETFMVPRKIALQAARDFSAGQSRSAVDSYLEAELKNWLTSLHLNSHDLVRAQTGTINLLIDHYAGLLKAEGDSYYDLIQNAYPSRESFEDYLHRITTAENAVDEAILAVAGDRPKIKEKLALEARQVQSRRQKILEDIF